MSVVKQQMIALSPCERPDPGLVAALCDAGALGVLDLGRDRDAAMRALASLASRSTGFGVRFATPLSIDLPAAAHTVIVDDVALVARFVGRTVLVQVTTLEDARAAIAAGAAGIIAKGCEAGGKVGDATTFVLVQQLVAELRVPIWAQGGIGVHTAAACIAGGATGIVLDSQLALVRESSLPNDVRAAIAAMDGSETVLQAGHRVFTRPDLKLGEFDPARLGGDSLHKQFLPIGQDAAFAKSIAQRFPSAAQLVRGMRAAIGQHLVLAASTSPLAPDAPLAAAHGMRYPIAQGPMSRVSDRARFAAAVAEGGGLPFLALTLMSGPEVRELLRETAALVGDKPWGVGILGFVPNEIREAQLAVLRELPPPVALIAGGRPSQAHPLEEQGTVTYLHVPSPGLLDLFLKDGARKFVFEGRECGGHVGPRSSFALWEAQLDRLLAHDKPEELSVLFAGGIHDARSAAMVAAMAAPLAARGAKIGVLMGTAYLFTEEAVAAGAIQPGFQQAAIECEKTVLLETAPGHATRCADTAFADAFAGEKRRLEAAGVAPQEMWAQLEQLNLGRLRIAAKGLERRGDQIVEVDETAQQREGMYMIGQVAALRRAVCTVADLHRDVSAGGTELLVAAAERLEMDDEHTRGTDIALIGIAAMFPGAPDTEAFWSNIVSGKNSVREIPPERWDVATYYDPAATGESAGRKTPSKWGGFLDDIPFEPLAYGIPPKSLSAIEPVQLLSLEIARRAIADSGYGERAFDRSRTAVIFGAEAGTDLSSAYSFRALFPHYVGPLPEALDRSLPTLSEDSFPGVLSNVIAGRIANRLDLGGVNYTVDAACAASLAALDMAVKELVSGSADMVLCGGADLHNSINDYLMFASVHALSPTGQCHTFDAHADGIVLGEGVACVVLKRLADAERDGDRVYAVIKGVAGASDGKSLGLTAPRKDGQVRALDRAYKVAGVSPAQVGLVEAHGTGTIVGDRTELATLTDVYAKAGAAAGTCVLGSVKSQIGHTKCAAGMAGLIKTALAIHHGVLPPTLNIKQPNPAWQPGQSPFVFLEQARPWHAEERYAAVSAFGFGGTNFHAVLASHRGEKTARATEAWPSELLVFRDQATIERVEKLIAAEPPPRLRDVARSVCAHGAGPVELAIVADSIADLKTKLAQAKAGKADGRGVISAGTRGEGGKVAFLCPGQGSQKPGMLAELFVAFPRLHRLLELGEKWVGRLYPPTAFTKEAKAAQQAALTDTRVAQPALGIVDLAVADLLRSFGVQPDMAAGHSYGELAALAVAGAIGEGDLLALSAARGEAIVAAAGADPGTMAAVAADPAKVAELVKGVDGVVVANWNSPTQCVLSGSTNAIDMAMALVGEAGLTARKIPVACAFHSAIVAGAKDALARTLAAMPIASPKLPVYSNTTAGVYPSEPDGVRELLADQVAKPVRFAQEIEAMYAAGARVFVETGPGQVLTKLVGEILGNRPHRAVACDAGDAGLRQLLRAVGTLACSGVAVDTSALFSDRDAAIIDLDPPAKPAPRASWLVNGHSARPANGEPMKLPTKVTVAVVPAAAIGAPPAMPSHGHHHQAASPVTAERDGVVLEYLRNMRSMIAAQRDVMLTYLGSSPAVVREVIDVAPAPQPIAAAPVPAPVIDGPTVPIVPKQIDPLQLVISIVSERTGYPADTLGIDLDLEADLSIDSIKRIEIIGELAQRLGLDVRNRGGDADAIVEELATRKTLRALVTWLTERLAKMNAAPAPATAAPEPIAAPEPTEAVVAPAPIGRYRLDVIAAPLPVNGFSTYAKQRFAIYDDGRVGAALVERLTSEGIVARIVKPGEELGELEGLVDLGGLARPADPAAQLGDLFEHARAAALGGAKQILIATGSGGCFGRTGNALALGGAPGIVKTLAAEWPGVKARAVDFDPADPPGAIAERLAQELHAADPHCEIGYANGVRSTVTPVAAELGAAKDLPLGKDSVVLITGGARGITARAAVELAKRYRCAIELVGRSALPGDEDPELAGALVAVALRKRLIERGGKPVEIEAQLTRVLADREIRATLADIRAAGGDVRYHACDVRGDGFAAVIDEIYARRGRIDAVIHAAGVLEDKLIKHKTRESFDRVVATKLGGAWTLTNKLRDDVKLIVMFSSISGPFGNKGQVDYAAAGDALDKLAWSLRRELSARVVSIDWGPWAGAGMVTPELAREYARRGVGLIDLEAGVAAMFAELAAGDDAQVVISAVDPRTFANRTERPSSPEIAATAEA